MGTNFCRAKGIRHVPWRSGRRTRSCGKTCGSSAQCSGSSGRIACFLPRLPTMSVHTVCWGTGRYPKASWSESWRLATGISIGSISLSVTIRGNATPCCSNGERRSLHYCIYNNKLKVRRNFSIFGLLILIISNIVYQFIQCLSIIIVFSHI